MKVITLEAGSKFNTIYTIGYGNRTMDEFIALLKSYQIEYLVDVRSAPYSRYNQDFSKAPLTEKLKEAGISYLFMGEQLGGKPEDQSCYTEGKVDYEKVSQTDFYRQGIARLKVALEKQYRVALMCSELKPELCHRSKLIGQTLDQQEIEVRHIDETGALQTQPEVINRLTDGQLNFFEQPFSSKKRYR